MSQEQILKMVQEGTITAEEGVRLLEAAKPASQAIEPYQQKNEYQKMLRIIVDATEDGKATKVKVNLPVALIKLLWKSGQNFDVNGIDLMRAVDIDMVLQAIDNDVMGEIVQVESEDANVRVFID